MAPRELVPGARYSRYDIMHDLGEIAERLSWFTLNFYWKHLSQPADENVASKAALRVTLPGIRVR